MIGKLTMYFDSLRQRIEELVLPRYQQLEAREQRIVRIAAVLLPLMIIVFGFLLPLQDKQKALRAQLITAQSQASEAEKLAQNLSARTVEQKNDTGSKDILTRVERLARETKVRDFMTRIKPNNSPDGSQKLMVRMKNVPYDATLRFIHALAANNLGINSLKLQAADAPGFVHVRAIITSS